MESAKKETFGFKTKNCPPIVDEMKSFEEGMTNIIRNISYKNTTCHFQEELKKDIATVKNEDHIFVKAEKSTNFYKLDTNQYNHLSNANVTKTYKKADKSKLDKIDKEAKNITTKLDLDDRVELMATKEASITLKDHKENFANRPTCRLINPSNRKLAK